MTRVHDGARGGKEPEVVTTYLAPREAAERGVPEALAIGDLRAIHNPLGSASRTA